MRIKKEPVSFFFDHYNTLMQVPEAVVLYQTILTLTEASKINREDKMRIKRDIAQIQEDLHGLQRYVTNSMLKYQGQGVTGLLPR